MITVTTRIPLADETDETAGAAGNDRGRGRPRSFSADDVLDVLVQLFWEQGYEATSMSDIVEASGLSKSSLYNTFGSKDELFGQALSRYVAFRSAMLTQVLEEGAAGLDDIAGFFDLLWSEVSTGEDHRGCLAVNTSTELGQRDEAVVEIGSRYRSMLGQSLAAALRRAADLDEIDPEQVDTYTNVLVVLVLGLAVIVRSGAPDDELRSRLDAARTMLDGWRLR